MPVTPVLVPVLTSLSTGPFALGPNRQYQVVTPIAEGGMGIVYSAQDRKNNDRPVAIKLLISRSEEMTARFRREIDAVMGLDHPNIVRTLDHGQDKEHGPFIVMELLQGETLEEFLDRQPYGRLSVEQAVEIAAPVCGALFYAHSQPAPLMHRDIKAANVFLCKNPDPSGKPGVKVMDFGLARDPDADFGGTGVRKKLTTAGIALGTLQYFAPEQCRGKPGLASDVYALGIMMYLMIEGRFPFSERLKEPEEFVTWHLQGVPERMTTCKSPLLKDLISKMLAKEPRKRPLLPEIQDVLRGIGENVLGSTVQIPVAAPLPCQEETSRMQLPVEAVPNLILPADAMTIRASSPRLVEAASPVEVIDDNVYSSRAWPAIPPQGTIPVEISVSEPKVFVDFPSLEPTPSLPIRVSQPSGWDRLYRRLSRIFSKG